MSFPNPGTVYMENGESYDCAHVATTDHVVTYIEAVDGTYYKNKTTWDDVESVKWRYDGNCVTLQEVDAGAH
jgi:hypothetical protein